MAGEELEAVAGEIVNSDLSSGGSTNPESPQVQPVGEGDLGSMPVPEGWEGMSEEQRAPYKKAGAFYQTIHQNSLSTERQKHVQDQRDAESWRMMGKADTRKKLFEEMGWNQEQAQQAVATVAAEEGIDIPEYLDTSDPKAVAKFIGDVVGKTVKGAVKAEVDPYVQNYEKDREATKQAQALQRWEEIKRTSPNAIQYESDVDQLMRQHALSVDDAYGLALLKTRMGQRGGTAMQALTPQTPATPPIQEPVSSQAAQPVAGEITVEKTDNAMDMLRKQAAAGDAASIELLKSID